MKAVQTKEGTSGIENFWRRLEGFYRRKSASLVFKRPFEVRPQQPLISFTFDDFPRSALLTGGTILNRHGLAGTYYASLGLMGQDTPSGKIFVAEDLDQLFANGHELGCHTFTHIDSWDAETDAFDKSIQENSAALRNLVPGGEFKTFSYPISLPRPRTKARAAAHFVSCRAGGQTLNLGRTDLNQLSAYFLEKSRNNIQAIKDMIDRNRQERGWLIFATHDICDAPTPFGCTPEFFGEVVQYAVGSGARIAPVIDALGLLEVPGSHEISTATPRVSLRVRMDEPVAAQPLVSILVPAYNAEEWIADTLRSAVAQTWERKEIIVIDDGSTDRTLEIARQFESDILRVVPRQNKGAAAARNDALSLSRGEYIQWLDADDLLAPDKIELQMNAAQHCATKRTLISSAFGKFMYRWYHADFSPTALWENLSPTEWLLRKMGENLYMQTATWLVSRELAEATGPWDTRLLSDDDGEYFCRTLLASDGVRFVPDSKVYHRFGYQSLSYIGQSSRKRDAHWISMQLHIKYLRSLEDSQRVRAACVRYLRCSLIYFYPDDMKVVRQAEEMALGMGGKLGIPSLSWKYSWVQRAFGWRLAKWSGLLLRKIRWSGQRFWDKTMCRLQNRKLVEDGAVADQGSTKGSKVHRRELPELLVRKGRP